MTSGMEFGRSPDHHSELSQATQAVAQLGPNHPLGVLSNLTALNMNVPSLSGLASGLHHGDVLEKLKMQVREMKVGALMGEQMAADFAASLHASSPFGAALAASAVNGAANGALGMFAGVGRDGAELRGSAGGSRDASGSGSSGSGGGVAASGGGSQGLSSGAQNGANFSFTLPNAPISKDGNPGSNSSTSSETSNSSQQNNGWSFEEQFKQVRQLYEINDDPKRKEFLDDLFLFMQKRGTPINRLPIMAKSVLDLYELYNLVIARGGLVDVINKKLWQEIIKGLHLPSSITSAAFTLRTQYMKYLYPYECEKKNLSTPGELQAAIDGNRREGRRSSYGHFDSPSVQRSPIPQSISQLPPLSLVSHVNQQQQQHHHHHRLLPPVGQLPNILPAEFEQRMLDYIKLFQPKEMARAQSPDQASKLSALNALEISRVALWNMYNPAPNSPPNSLNTSPENNMQSALDLSESPDHAMASIKRERAEHHPVDFSDPRDYSTGLPPPAKRSHLGHQHHHHSRSLTPLKLHNSSHDEDEVRSGSGTPINLRENGGSSSLHHHHLHHHHHHNPDDEDSQGEDSQEGPTEENNMIHHHPLALSLADHHHRERERAHQQVAAHVAARFVDNFGHEAAPPEAEKLKQHMATLDLSILDRERLRCDSADKLKQRQQKQQQQQQQQQQQEQQHQRQQQQQQASKLAKNGNGDHRLSLTPDSEFHHAKTSSAATAPATGAGGSGLPDPFSSPLGITGMQFKLISRGDASKGDQKLVVTMEFNGVQYEGVLFANPMPLSSTTAPSASTPPSSSISATSASPIGSLVSPVKTATISALDERGESGGDVSGSADPASAALSSNTSGAPLMAHSSPGAVSFCSTQKTESGAPAMVPMALVAPGSGSPTAGSLMS
ncbi:protein dead ringer [Anopheles cruzii]|uniref:protein dead ringer n=1 Tax=Anopheles cruzii TaxID=68878 RepID=UPI0022EC622D|nr:protein dead ringer [Anopheles cruzii]